MLVCTTARRSRATRRPATPAPTCNSGGRAFAAGCTLLPRLCCCIWRDKCGLPRHESTARPSRRDPTLAAWGGAAWDITDRITMR